MFKKILVIVGMFLSVICNTTFLGASDTVIIKDLDQRDIVKTLPYPEHSNEPIAEQSLAIDDDLNLNGFATPIAASPVDDSIATTKETVVQSDAISYAGHVIPIVDVPDTAVDAGDHVNKYGNKFLYGHNSSAVFRDLIYLGVGNVFMVSYGGVTTTYQVAEVQIFEKSSPTSLSSNGVNYKMSAIANGKGRYDVVLMTCHGTMYENGDASHRLVVFANRI